MADDDDGTKHQQEVLDNKRQVLLDSNRSVQPRLER